MGILARVSAAEIAQWAATMAAQSKLPALVRRLVHGTGKGLIRVEFPDAEGVLLPGADGRVEAGQAHEYVPGGTSMWELSTERDPGTKAEADYRKRTAFPPPGIDPSTTTYVAVSARTWHGKAAWELKHRELGVWAEVRAYDANTLAEWLEQCPGAAAWLAEELGKPTLLSSLADAFQVWSQRTKPPTSEELVLAGREQSQAAWLRWLRSPASMMTVDCRDPDEAVAFLFATVRQLPPAERDSILDRAVVARNDDALAAFLGHPTPVICVALDCDIGIARAAASAHHHVLVHQHKARLQERLGLEPLAIPRTVAALEAMGIGVLEAQRIARDAGGDLVGVRAHLGDDTASVQADAVLLALAGSWHERNDRDLNAIVQIADIRDTVALRERVRALAAGPRALLRERNGIVSVGSRLAVLRNAEDKLRNADLRRFAQSAIDVLSAAGDAVENDGLTLLSEQLQNEGRTHSATLRTAIADGLAIVATSPRADAIGTDIAACVVNATLDTDAPWQRLGGLRVVMPKLAEAAPEAFIRAMRAFVERSPATIEALVEHSKSAGLVHLDHLSGIVDGLEVVAWSSEYVVQAVRALVSIAEIERRVAGGDRNRDTAAQAVRSILLPWLPRTAAPLDVRKVAIKAVADAGTETAAAILISLLPQFGMDTAGNTSLPRWRDWASGAEDRVMPEAECLAAYGQVLHCLLSLVKRQPGLWPKLLPALRQLPSAPYRRDALASLEALAADTLGDDIRVELWHLLRRELNTHRRFHEARWALAASEVAVLERAYLHLAPGDPVAACAWLFARGAVLPDAQGHDHHAEAASIEAAKDAAIVALHARLGADGVVRLAQAPEVQPFRVGQALARAVGLVVANELLRAIAEDTPGWIDFRAGIGAGLAPELPINELATALGLDELPPEQRAHVALGRIPAAQVWDQLGFWGTAAVGEYWRHTSQYMTGLAPDEVIAAARHMLAVDRPFAAASLMECITRHGAGTDSDTLAVVDLVLRVAHDAAVHGQSVDTMDGYNIRQLLDALAAGGPEWEDKLLVHEWRWFQLLQYDRPPAVLYRALASSPAFFVDLLKLVYRAEGSATNEEATTRSGLAAHAYSVLRRWDALPGRTPDGALDSAALQAWVQAVRAGAAASGHARVAESEIGQVLARSPAGRDGQWPHEAVRDVLEAATVTTHLETGFVIGKRNLRGVYSKAMFAGGDSERQIAAGFARSAAALTAQWPQTAALLERLERDYQRDASAEDERAKHDRAECGWAPNATDRLASWLDNQQAQGKFAIVLASIPRTVGTAAEVEVAAAELVERHRLAPLGGHAFALVPLEYREEGFPPAEWFIDQWMAAIDEPYAVGLLTAAALHGAAHQAPQGFQVLTRTDREPVAVGKVRIQFIADAGAGQMETQAWKTATGTMRVTTAAQTVIGLAAHLQASGGVDHVATVLDELTALVHPARFAELAKVQSTAVLQTLGYLLQCLHRRKLAAAVQLALSGRQLSQITLRDPGPAPKSGTAPNKWLVFNSRSIEVDR